MNFPAFNSVVETTFTWAWRTSLQTTLLIALVWVIQIIFNRTLAPRWRYALGLLIVLRLMLPIAPASSFSIFNLVPHHVPTPTAPAAVPVQTTPTTALPASSNETFLPPPKPALHYPIKEIIWLTGCGIMLGLAVKQQRKLARQLKNHLPIIEPRMVALLHDCKMKLGIKRHIMLHATSTLNTPALFGSWRPRLLIPEEMLSHLNDRELRLIFLHELTHLKRGDVLVNWLIIFARAVHWFNPLVWLAMKRLRADQELACDAAVMDRLAVSERKLYGETLFKLIADFSVSPTCPGLVPFITNQQLIKRRIIMIAKFKPGGRIAAIGAMALTTILCGATFTRARNATNSEITATNAPPFSPVITEHVPKEVLTKIDTWKLEMHDLDRQVVVMEAQVDAVRLKMGALSNQVTDIKISSEKRLHYENLSVEAEMSYIKEEKLLERLRSLRHDELIQILPTATSDTTLSQLLGDLNSAQARLATLRVDYGDDHPEVVRVVKLREMLNKQIDARTAGILEGMQAKIDALKAVVENGRRLSREMDAEAKFKPYEQLQAKLEQLRKKRDIMVLKVFEELGYMPVSFQTNGASTP